MRVSANPHLAAEELFALADKTAATLAGNQIGGEPTSDDPFVYTIEITQVQDFVSDWRAIQ